MNNLLGDESGNIKMPNGFFGQKGLKQKKRTSPSNFTYSN